MTEKSKKKTYRDLVKKLKECELTKKKIESNFWDAQRETEFERCKNKELEEKLDIKNQHINILEQSHREDLLHIIELLTIKDKARFVVNKDYPLIPKRGL